MIYWILTTPRSGSNYIAAELWRRLGGTPKPMEYFNPTWRGLGQPPRRTVHGDDAATLRFPAYTPRQGAPVAGYLDHLLQTEGRDGILCVKMLWLQVDACCRHADFLPALRSGPIIHLFRRDVIRQGISRYLATQTGQWASREAPSLLPVEEVPYDFAAIAANVAYVELHDTLLRRFLLAHGLEHVRACYEDFLADPDAEANRILDLLGLARHRVPPAAWMPYVRQSTVRSDEFYERYVAEERERFRTGGAKGLRGVLDDGVYTGPPLFPDCPSDRDDQ